MYAQKLLELRDSEYDMLGPWHDCDSALWAGIARAGGADWIDMGQFVTGDGRPTRIPNADCEPPRSRATTSNDMMTGIILGLLVSGDADSLNSMWDYGAAHTWVMGYPEYVASRTVLRPNGITLLARAIHSLDGKDFSVRNLPVIYGPVEEDFEEHLRLVSLQLQNDIGGYKGVQDLSHAVICAVPTRDAFQEAVCGNYNDATDLLLGDYKYPSYVRGQDNYYLAHWLNSARIILDSQG